jgi:hypothetical protein
MAFVLTPKETETIALHGLLADKGIPYLRRMADHLAVHPLDTTPPSIYGRRCVDPSGRPHYDAPAAGAATVKVPTGLATDIVDLFCEVVQQYMPDAGADILRHASQKLTGVYYSPEPADTTSMRGRAALLLYLDAQFPERRLPLLLGATVEAVLVELLGRTHLPNSPSDPNSGGDL